MRVACALHPETSVEGSYCPDCAKREIDRLKQQGITGVTASFGHINSVLVEGKPAIAQHPYEYMEYAVPSILLKRLEGIVESEIARFQKSCECVSCILERERKEKE